MGEEEVRKIDIELHKTFTLMNIVTAIGRDITKKNIDFQTAQAHIQRCLLERKLQGDLDLSLNGKSLVYTFAVPGCSDFVTLEVEDCYGRYVQGTVKYRFRYPVVSCSDSRE